MIIITVKQNHLEISSGEYKEIEVESYLFRLEDRGHVETSLNNINKVSYDGVERLDYSSHALKLDFA